MKVAIFNSELFWTPHFGTGLELMENHFILDRGIGGPDASFSMTEQEFTEMVTAVREAEKAVGVVGYELTPKQVEGRRFCRSLYVVKDINKGEVITEEYVRSIRPGFGGHPKELKNIIGQVADRDFGFGERWESTINYTVNNLGMRF